MTLEEKINVLDSDSYRNDQQRILVPEFALCDRLTQFFGVANPAVWHWPCCCDPGICVRTGFFGPLRVANHGTVIHSLSDIISSSMYQAHRKKRFRSSRQGQRRGRPEKHILDFGVKRISFFPFMALKSSWALLLCHRVPCSHFQTQGHKKKKSKECPKRPFWDWADQVVQ